MTINGIWEGFYEYGLGYNLPEFGQRIMTQIEFKGNAIEFKGKVLYEEKSRFSVPFVSELNGFIELDHISFRLSYTDEVSPGREIEASTFDKNNLIVVDYLGIIDDKYQSMYGNWIISDILHLNEVTDDDLMPCEGIWLLKKKL
ncbi:MAG: hypothetical protein AAF487_11435 [Bacteroidota bacterium]